MSVTMGKSKILVISERYWPEGSGGELATHLIVGILSREFEVTVITGTKDPYRIPHVNYIYKPLLSKREKPLLWFNMIKLVKRERFRKLIEESDVVYIPRFAFPVIPFAKRLGKRVVVHLHDYIPISYTAIVPAPYEEHKHRIVRDNIFLECVKGLRYCLGVGLLWWLPKLVREWILQADKVVCVSRRHAEIIVDQIPELKDQVEVVYNPLPYELINIKPIKELDDTPTFLYVGGDSYVKGFHVLLQAMKYLGKRGVKARFILTNKYSPESLSALKQLGEKYRNLEIEVMGKIEYSKLLEVHKKVWALIFPSIWEEPLPYAVIEAIVQGAMPIASKVGGIPQIIKDTPSELYLFNHKNPDELVNKINNLISKSVEEIISIGNETRKRVFALFNSIEKTMIKVFKDIVS